MSIYPPHYEILGDLTDNHEDLYQETTTSRIDDLVDAILEERKRRISISPALIVTVLSTWLIWLGVR